MSRLIRFVRVVVNIRGAKSVVGTWSNLLRQLIGVAGVRAKYGLLIGLVAVACSERQRWYRRWLDTNEQAMPRRQSKVLLVVSFDGVDENGLALFVAKLEAGGSEVAIAVDSESRHLERRLRLGDWKVSRFTPEFFSQWLNDPGDCVGVVFLSRGYCLNRDALTLIGDALAQGADIVYGDVDEIDESGLRRSPYFKPDFSIDLIMYQDYAADCVGISFSLARRALQWDFGDPYGTVLLLLQHADDIRHVPAILSHRFARRRDRLEPPDSLELLLKSKYGDRAHVEIGPVGWRCRFPVRGSTRSSIIIPTRDKLELLKPCVASLYDKNERGEFEVIIIDNGSSNPATIEWLDRAADVYTNLKVLTADVEFNWSALSNLGIATADGDVLVFLNNDTVSHTHEWIERICEYAMRSDVGVVGPLLLFADGTIQHAGVVVGYGGCADHVYRGARADFDAYGFVSPTLPRNVSAVTGACLAISRRTLDTIGGFDERYRVAGGDVELGIRAYTSGLSNVYAPDIVLYHHESQSRRRKDPPEDVDRLRGLVMNQMPLDPFYNPNLTLTSLYPSFYV